jgi:hypothetical protein
VTRVKCVLPIKTVLLIAPLFGVEPFYEQ